MPEESAFRPGSVDGTSPSAPTDDVRRGVRERRRGRWQALRICWVAAYLSLLANCAGYLFEAAPGQGPARSLFLGSVLISYTFLYLLPLFGVFALWNLAIDRPIVARLLRAIRVSPSLALLIPVALGVCLVHVAVFGDRMLYGLYGFHLNGFVLNLITTRGGLESLGGSDSSTMSAVLLVSLLIVLQSLLFWVLLRCAPCRRIANLVVRKRPIALGVLLVLVLGVTERITYLFSSLVGHTPVLAAADAFPFYLPATWKRLGTWLGIERPADRELRFSGQDRAINYPLAEIRRKPPAKPLNIVWLVSESLRADMLDPEIMPRTWDFSLRSARFSNHFSGGNGTRMGMFSMFYGLHGPYWFPFLDARRGPLLMDVLLEDRYEMQLFTSAAFTYPEFDRTVFSQVPAERLHELESGVGWVRDRELTGQLVSFLAERDRSRPFFTFMFFESPHARYYFPPECVIREPYLEDFNYVTMNLERDIELIKNRYINSCHHLDSQIDRILQALEKDSLLDSTLVVITGDHGEEFLERGRWGHNSHFSPEQIRVPLVLFVPGRSPETIDRLTSHLDLPATVLPLLGVQNEPQDYSLGFDLFGAIRRDHTVLADWSSVVYVDPQFTAQYPLKGLRLSGEWNSDLSPVVDRTSFDSAVKPHLRDLLVDLKRFSR